MISEYYQKLEMMLSVIANSNKRCTCLRSMNGAIQITGAAVHLPALSAAAMEVLADHQRHRVHNHHRNIRHDSPILNAQTGFLTTDQLVELRNGSSATAQEDAFAIANQFSRRRSPEKQ